MITRIAIILLFAGFFPPVMQAQKDCVPVYKGFYYFKLNETNSAVLRFFENGEVIATTSSNKYNEVEDFFTLERKDLMLHGKYRWKKCGSSFIVKGDTGEQHYDVKKVGDELSVTIEDKTTGKSTSRTYSFYHMTK
jgi:hypothetical protein